MNNLMNLVRKDFLLHKKFVLWMAALYPLYLGFFGSRMNSMTVLPVISGFLYAIVPLIVFGREDKFKSESFSLSLPVTRQEFLRARYLLSWGMMTAMLTAGSLLIVIAPGSKLSAAVVLGPRMILLSLAFLSVCFGVMMPLFVRFGQAGMLAFVVVLQLLGVVFMILRKVIPAEAVKAVFRLIPNAVAALQSALGPVLSFLAGLALLAAFSYLSFALSLALFRKKEF